MGRVRLISGLLRGDKDPHRFVKSEEFVAADRDGIERNHVAVHQIFMIRER